MAASLAGSKIRSLGSAPLPISIKTDVRSIDIKNDSQIPHRTSQNTHEYIRQHAESDQWFDEANLGVNSHLDGLGDDAPFFLDDVEPIHYGENNSSSVPLDDPVLSYMRTNDSERENEELRGIIDDLTLDIKRLKQKLRRYKERDPPHLRRDKLFDVRTYGLSGKRKRYLERILQRFAADMSSSPHFSKDRHPLPKSNHMTLGTHISDDDAHVALVAMLFEQHLCSSQFGPDDRHSPNASSSSPESHSSWYNVDELLTSIKQMIAQIDIDMSRRAVKRYGTNVELSADGHCVRRRSSQNRDRLHDHMYGSLERSSRFRNEALHPKAVLGHEIGNMKSNRNHNHNHFNTNYKPYTLISTPSEADDVMSIISSGSEISAQASISDIDDRNSVTRPGAQVPITNHPQDRLTYYKDTPFCIDYSGDIPDLAHSRTRRSSGRQGSGEIRKRRRSPGLSQRRQRRPTANSAVYRFLSYPSEKDVPVNLSQCSSPVLSLGGEPLSSVADNIKAVPTELKASGVGDVVLDDNFAIHVVMKHAPIASNIDPKRHDSSSSSGKNKDRTYDKPVTSRVSDHPSKDTIASHRRHEQRKNNQNNNSFQNLIVTTFHERLSPSSLPPATCGFFSSASSDDDDEDGDDGDDELEGFDEHEDVRHVDTSMAMMGLFEVTDEDSSASRESIKQWSAQVVASFEEKENESGTENVNMNTDLI